MTIQIVNKDLFTVPHEYYLAHCISDDFALGAGIAKQFNSKYNMRFKLENRYGDTGKSYIGTALLIDNVFNLVTKERYWHKPTYTTLKAALICMRDIMESVGIKKIAMPKIGCGLDKLEWDKVYNIICDVFADCDVEILICEI